MSASWFIQGRRSGREHFNGSEFLRDHSAHHSRLDFASVAGVETQSESGFLFAPKDTVGVVDGDDITSIRWDVELRMKQSQLEYV